MKLLKLIFMSNVLIICSLWHVRGACSHTKQITAQQEPGQPGCADAKGILFLKFRVLRSNRPT